MAAQAYSTLLSSESEDEAAGPVASVRRWWTGKKPKRCTPHCDETVTCHKI